MPQQTIFTNSHLLHSHYLHPNQPQSQAPPSSFGRPTTGTLRSSLRKIPSSLFAGHKDKEGKEKKSRKDKVGVPTDSASRPMKKATSPLRHPAPPKNTEDEAKGKSKTKTKTRKALGEIFGWGNSHSHASNPVPAIQPAKAPIPPPVPTKDTTMRLKKAPSTNRLSNKSSQSGLSGYSSLHPPQEPISAGRPSIGDDPFGRKSEGAEVVDHVTRHAMIVPSIKGAVERRGSIGSSKAFSTKTVFSDESSIKEPSIKPRSTTPQPAAALPIVAEYPQARRVSVPMSSIATLVELPPRSASLGRALNVVPAQLVTELPAVNAVAFPTKETSDPIKTLKKEKTKSKVWGFLAGKKTTKKTEGKSDTTDDIKTNAYPDSYIKINIAPEEQPASVARAATVRSIAPSMRSSRPRPPVLHVSHPYNDEPCTPQLTGSTLPSPPTTAQPTPAGIHPFESNFGDSPPRSATSSGEGGIWESVVGSIADRRSVEGPRQVVAALMAPKGVPKRKSLTGLFGLSLKRSLDKIRGTPAHTTDGSSLGPWAPPRLKSLAEEMEEAGHGVSRNASCNPFVVEHPADVQNKQTQRNSHVERSLRRVASATDRLLTLVSRFDHTPTASPSNSRSPSLAPMKSLQSLRDAPNGSPTPLRKFRSAMLSLRPSVSPLKPTANVSPLKLALHRAQIAARYNVIATPPAVAVSPPKNSLVKKGMRNIFAPPSPAIPKPSPTKRPATKDNETIEALGVSRPPSMASSPAMVTDKHVGMGQTMGPAIVEERFKLSVRKASTDIPSDLRDIISSSTTSPLSSTVTATLGLPLPPSRYRFSPRRPARAPPAISLPPLPDDPLSTAQGRISPIPPQISLEFAKAGGLRDSVFSDILSATGDFDFTNEYAALDRGDQRASFVEAVQHFGGRRLFGGIGAAQDLPPLPAMPSLGTIEQSPDFHAQAKITIHGLSYTDSDGETETEHEREESFADALEAVEEMVQIARPMVDRHDRPKPFQGQLAFQQRMSEVNQQTINIPMPPASVADQEVASPPPAPLPAPTRRRGHRRDESGLSIATMSSIGAVIETGIAGEYTNYFEVNFSQQLDQQRRDPGIDVSHDLDVPTDAVSPLHPASRDSISLAISDAVPARRAPTRRAHHRFNSSIVSIELIPNIEIAIPSGPPVSLHNPRRSIYVSKHRRNGSADSGWGRADWAAHRRNSSVDSVVSNVSVSRIARPGLGERMFQLDGGVQLTSITGSPPDEPDRAERYTEHSRQPSLDSLLDSEANTSYDSIFHSSIEHNRSSSTSTDSIFDATPVAVRKEFFLRGVRPQSTISVASSESPDDTFINIAKYSRRYTVQAEETCLQTEGEGDHTFTPVQTAELAPHSGRQVLNDSISRPAKPRSAQRRRPAHLVFEAVPSTPGLTSPSASETSSRMSLETKFSEVPSISSGRARPRGAGHHRQKSSAVVNLEATIKEEPSMATLRAPKGSTEPQISMHRPSRRDLREPDVASWAEDVDSTEMVTTWLHFQREADAVCRSARSFYRDSEESKSALADFKMPLTNDEVSDFLAKSTAAYKPLQQLPIGRITHRRKSSLSDSRGLTSPYGLPLPKLTQPNKPKGSLTTKFERSNSSNSNHSATSSIFSFAEDRDAAPPPSAIFAQFTSQYIPSPPPNQSHGKVAPLSTFQLPAFDAFGIQKPEADAEAEKRASIKAVLAMGGAGGSPTQGGEKRSRVNSQARRQALGWGRRRNSDGPAKVVDAMTKNIPPVPKTATGATFGRDSQVRRSVANKENEGGYKARVVVRNKVSARKVGVPKVPSRSRALRI